MNFIRESNSANEAKYVAYYADDSIKIEMEVPGYEKDDIEVKATSEVLTVSAKKKEDVGKGHFATGFYNRFDIKSEKLKVNASGVNVSLVNGILTIRIEIKDEYKSTVFSIQ